MPTKQRVNVTPIVIGLTTLALGLVLSYFAAYCAMSDVFAASSSLGPEARVFNHKWQADFFTPAATLESVLFRKEVCTGWIETSLPLDQAASQ